jgi:hypothetical protein
VVHAFRFLRREHVVIVPNAFQNGKRARDSLKSSQCCITTCCYPIFLDELVKTLVWP